MTESPIVNIRVELSESPSLAAGAEFATLSSFDRAVREASFEAPKGGAYHKVRAIVTFRDGRHYGCRLDVMHYSCEEAVSGLAAVMLEDAATVLAPGYRALFFRLKSATEERFACALAEARLLQANLKVALIVERLALVRARYDEVVELQSRQAAVNAGLS